MNPVQINSLSGYESNRSYLEWIAHLFFWVFIFSAVNVDWGSSWLDRSIRPDTPSPFSVLIFPILFYAHAFWSIPKFLNHGRYLPYFGSLILIFFIPELLRAFIFSTFSTVSYTTELGSKDSLLIGSPMTAWLAFVVSTGYRFTKDWFLHRKLRLGASTPPEPLGDIEAEQLQRELQVLMSSKKPYLNSGITLKSLSLQLNISAKTLSKLLNQHLDTGFSDYVNSHRIKHFIDRVSDGDLESLSIAGLAAQCGFSSKTSFYRAFKKKTGTTPSEYFQRLQ